MGGHLGHLLIAGYSGGDEVFILPVILDNDIDQTHDKSGIRSRTNPDIVGCLGCQFCPAWVNNDNRGVVDLLGMENVLH